MKDLIEIDKYPVKDVLSLLLKDKATGNNIIFATDTYSDYGYSECNYMTEMAVQGFASCDIQPRVLKAKSEQIERTRKKAEVFTPTWICNKMNNACDRDWFERKTVFNIEKEHKWSTVSKAITFPEGKDWKCYVDSRRLEITCGEAPYLVSRYDTTTGNVIPIQRRIGILDRKLRVVSENTNSEEEWLKWTIRAFQSVYGYEFQGDNLLIARINLLVTFCDYLYDKWQRTATKIELKKIANIITWNIWQMDGFKNTPPDITIEDDFLQMTFFEVVEEDVGKVFCKVQDWRKDRPFIFKDLKIGKKGKNMKFDYLIGNPPYQENDGGAGASAKPVYNKFVESAKEMANIAFTMITPSRWFAGGKGLDDFREAMLKDRRITKIVDYVNAKDCFPNTSIGGGVNYFVWKKYANQDCEFTNIHDGKESTTMRNLNDFPVFVRYNEAVNIIKKVKNYKEDNITDKIETRNPFGLSSNYRGTSTKTEKKNIKLYSSQGTSYISSDEVTSNKELIGKYKVMISKVTSEHAGEPAKDGKFRVISTNKIILPNEVCTDSYLIVFSSDSMEETQNFKSYLDTNFFRFLLLQAVSSINLSKDKFVFIPRQDYSQPINDDLMYKKYNLTPEEIEFIQSIIKEIL